MFLLNCLLRGCIFGLSGPLVSQMVGGAMAPLAPPVPTPMYRHQLGNISEGHNVAFNASSYSGKNCMSNIDSGAL